ncbi:uracil-DNA glycosylase [Candidatus Shapirobacteria bacterium]|nr:uracil-DNA glycosylase [Candidatus Shapirobacteria bacterium]
MDVKIEPTWKSVLEKEFDKDYFGLLSEFVKKEYASKTIYPPPGFIFRAFWLTPFDKVKVVIIGQDPYHGPKQANGLCFAVNKGVTLPPSVQNIYKEIESDLDHKSKYPEGDLEEWAKQGVLLLNATLTVEANKAGSHQNKGWENFTDKVIKLLSEQREHLVFILWGNYAKKKGVVIDRQKHLVIESPHPSPFAARSGFFGSKPFSKCNEYLILNGCGPIVW